jgi:uncharacterized protein YbaP (TraB family)
MRSCQLIIIIFFSSLVSHAQDTTSYHSVFWEVSGNGLASPSYLYGTTHFICKEDLPFTDSVKNKMASCKSMYTETIFNGDTAEMLEKRASKGLTLKQIIGKNDFKRVQRFFSANEKMTDSFLNTFSTAKLEFMMIKEHEKCVITSVDWELSKLAKAGGIDMYGLESQAEHFSYEKAPSISDQADHIFFVLNNFDRDMEQTRYKIDLYLNGDLEKLYLLSAINRDGSKSDMAIGGEKRNKLWIPRMEAAMRERPCFFAFGCNHLIGENGVINLLRQEGYVVRPLYY